MKYHHICEPTNLLIYNKSKYRIYETGSNTNYTIIVLNLYVVGSKHFWSDIQKPRQMENAVRDI